MWEKFCDAFDWGYVKKMCLVSFFLKLIRVIKVELDYFENPLQMYKYEFKEN